MGQPGHERPGGGNYRARRPRNRDGLHHGLDISGVLNVSPVVANRDGTVLYAGVAVDGLAGNIVVIEHEGGVITTSAHLNSMSVSARQRVREGQTIGILGDTGNARGTPPHVHFRVTVNGVERNPATYLNSACP